MAKISKPSEQIGKIGVPNLSPQATLGSGIRSARAATSGMINAGQQLIKMGQIEMEQNKRVAQLGAKAKAMNELTLEFATAVDQRESTTVDDDGNPTYTTLTKDVGALGKKLLNNKLSKVKDPEVRAAITQEFNNQVMRAQVSSLSSARKQRNAFAVSAAHTEINTILNEASRDEYGSNELYEERVSRKIDEGLSSGIYTPQQATLLKQRYIDEIRYEQAVTAIDKDPEGFYKGQLPGLKDRKLNTALEDKIEMYARTKYREKLKEDIDRTKQREEYIKKQQDINYVEMDTKIDLPRELGGNVTMSAIDYERDRNNFTALQAAKLRKKLQEKMLKETKDDLVATEVATEIHRVGNANHLSDEKKNKFYEKQISGGVKDSEGELRPMTLADKTAVVLNIKSSVPRFTKELNASLLSGDTTRMMEGYAAYRSLHRPDSVNVLEDLSSKALAIATAMDVRIRDLGMTQEQAAESVRQSYIRAGKSTSKVKDSMDSSAEFDVFAREKIAQEVITDVMVGNDGFWGTIVTGNGLFTDESQYLVPPELLDQAQVLLQELYLEHRIEGDGDIGKTMDLAQDSLRQWVRAKVKTTTLNKGSKNEKTVLFNPPEAYFKQYKPRTLERAWNTMIKARFPDDPDPSKYSIQSDAFTVGVDQISYRIYKDVKQSDGSILTVEIPNVRAVFTHEEMKEVQKQQDIIDQQEKGLLKDE